VQAARLSGDVHPAVLARLPSLSMTPWTTKISGQCELAGVGMTHLSRDALLLCQQRIDSIS